MIAALPMDSSGIFGIDIIYSPTKEKPRDAGLFLFRSGEGLGQGRLVDDRLSPSFCPLCVTLLVQDF